jgi:polyisoprenoid-binding protein YceI
MKTRKIKFLAFLVVFFALANSVFAESVNVNASASTVKWNGKKVGGEHYGSISVKEGVLDIEKGVVTGGTVVIDMNSMTCQDLTDPEWNNKLIGHLKSDDFFSVASYPTAQLVLTKAEKSGSTYTFTGNLTIKGITNPVTFKANVASDNRSFKGMITVDRSKFNVRYGSKSFFDNLGDKVISDEFTLDFNLVLSK